MEDLFASDIVYPQERGETQVEVKRSTEIESADEASRPLLLVTEYGLTELWELGAEWDRTNQNLRVGVRKGFRCLHGSDYHASLGLEWELSEASDARLEPTLIVARAFGDRAYAFTSWAVTAPIAPHAEVMRLTLLSEDVGLAVRVIRGIRLVAEVPAGEGREVRPTVQAIAGLLWHWRDHLELGAAALMRVTRDADRGGLMHAVVEIGGQHERSQGLQN